MSADLVIAALVIDERRELDFEAALRVVEGLGSEDVEEPDFFDVLDPDEPEGLREIRTQLRADLRQLQEAIVNWDVEIAELTVRGATVYVSGGLSYGDAPTEVCNVISRLRAVRGVLAAAGFEEEG